MSKEDRAIWNELKFIKDCLANISADIAEIQKRPCQLLKTKTKPFTAVPNTYFLMLDVEDIEDSLCATAIIHLLPTRGNSGGKQVNGTCLHRVSKNEALLSTLGSSLKVIATHCPEKLVICTRSKLIENVVKFEKNWPDNAKERRLADYLKEDIDALRKMFPIEVKRDIPEAHLGELKSLIAQAELEYIRQKEKVDVTARPRSSKDS